MKMKAGLGKGTALVLSAALVLGLAPVIPGNIYNRALADTAAAVNSGTAQEPSVQVYADKDTLMGDTFDPGSDGTQAKAVAKLKFGKSGDNAIEWYILGPDKGIEGNNIAIFVTDNIGKEAFFDWESVITTAEADVHTYTGDEDEEYVKGTRTPDSDMVAYSHYGESNIRKALRKMADASDTTYDYFSRAEKDLMQKTKVLTHEWDNEDMLYTTKDKLYLASVQSDGSSRGNVIYVGSTGIKSISDEYTSKTLQWDPYWKGASETLQWDPYWKGASESDILEAPEDWFWTRSPETCEGVTPIVVATALNGGGPLDPCELYSCGVRPASNLKLTNVLFASAAEAENATEVGKVSTLTPSDVLNNDETEVIKKQDAMTLRMKGDSESAKTALDGKTIGGVATASDSVKVTRGTTEKTVTLIIQGKDADTDDATGADWYYAKTIDKDTTAVTVPKTDITGHAGVSLADCKIWLEAKDEENNIIYAVDTNMEPAHEHTYDDTWTQISAEQHAHLCTAGADCTDLLGSAKDKEPHTYNNYNVCTKCGYRYGEHIVSYIKEKPATSTAVGYKEHFECSHCEEWFIYPATLGTLISQPKSYFEIPATGGSSNSGTTYSDGSTRNSDRYSSVSSSASQNSLGSPSSSGLTARSNSASGWSQDTSGKWWYYDGNTKITGWVYDKSDGRWYYVDANKGRVYGWFYDTEDGYWYYLDANTGAMLTGWQLIGGKQYYFAPAPAAATYTFDTSSSKWVYSNAANYRPYGSMYANTTTPDNHSVDADGVKIQ